MGAIPAKRGVEAKSMLASLPEASGGQTSTQAFGFQDH
jgi:hypothetical protein